MSDRVGRDRRRLQFVLPGGHSADGEVVEARVLLKRDSRFRRIRTGSTGEVWATDSQSAFDEVDRALAAPSTKRAQQAGHVDVILVPHGAVVTRDGAQFRGGVRSEANEERPVKLAREIAEKWSPGEAGEASKLLSQHGRRLFDVVGGGLSVALPDIPEDTRPLQFWVERMSAVARLPLHAALRAEGDTPLGLSRPLAVNRLRELDARGLPTTELRSRREMEVYAPDPPDTSFSSRGSEITSALARAGVIPSEQKHVATVESLEGRALDPGFSCLIVHGLEGQKSHGTVLDRSAPAQGCNDSRPFHSLLMDVCSRLGSTLEVVVLDVCNSNGPWNEGEGDERTVLDLLDYCSVLVATAGRVPDAPDPSCPGGESLPEYPCDCSGFIASFIEGMYAGGLSAGEAMLAARKQDREAGSFAWRHYCLYGDVTYRVNAQDRIGRKDDTHAPR